LKECTVVLSQFSWFSCIKANKFLSHKVKHHLWYEKIQIVILVVILEFLKIIFCTSSSAPCRSNFEKCYNKKCLCYVLLCSFRYMSPTSLMKARLVN
jgi:hypothetical protein